MSVWRLDGGAVEADALAGMRDTLVNRGPDDAGMWTQGPVGLGHRRLSILDLSAAGRMPMTSQDGKVVAVFNGEIYNYRELREELRSEGCSFASETDSEVMLRAYEVWGAASFERLNGMFAIAIWDGRSERMVFARDPAGQKPLYFGYRPGHWLLAGSTLAPLIHYAGSELGINQDVVRDYVRFGYPPGGRAMLNDVHTVPPGSFVTVAKGEAPRVTRYFDLVAHAEGAAPRTESDETLMEEFQALMRDAVNARLVSDVPLGAFLSGGLDSSLVVAMMAEREPEAVKTYTIGFDQLEFDESEHAKKIAAHLGVQNTVKVLRGQDVLSQLPDVIRYFDEPMADYSVLPGLAVSKLAREHVTVALTGDGADEEFGGYKYYLAQRWLEQYVQGVPRAARSALAGLSGLVPSAGAQRILRRSGATDAALLFGLGGFYRGAASNAVDRLLGEHNVAAETVAEFLRAHPLGSSVEAGMLYDATHTLPHAWLYKVDRTSMAGSLEARSPFLDRRVLEFAFTLPLRMRLRGGQKKYIVRQLLRSYLPDDLVDRPKQGFTAPVAHWLRHDLRDALEVNLAEDVIKNRGLFDSAMVSALIQEHVSGTQNHAQILWALLVLEWWMQHHVEGRSIDDQF